MRSIRPTLVAIGGLLVFVMPTAPQVRPVYDQGAAGIRQALKRLNSSASVLMIGAHPDDEDTALLAYLARGESARTAYLSLTRGDGGQNIIGTELGEALGVIRTEELIQARRLDGAEQYFTRAYDYGFSKTLDEAKSKWNEKIVLCDAVRVIRFFRPQVIISQFSGTPADGHGQHQFAGYIAPLVMKAAADVAQCPNTGEAWTVQKFYTRHRGQGEPALRINTGKFDPVIGRSYFEIAMEARSQHKSQEQGVLELRGDQFSSLGGTPATGGIFAGTEVKGDPKILEAAEKALALFDPKNPSAILPDLVRGYSLAETTSYKRRKFAEAIAMVAGLQVDALADSETIAPGETLFVSAKAFAPEGAKATLKEIKLMAPEGWAIAKTAAPTANGPAFVTREAARTTSYFNATVPTNEKPIEPYWLAEPRDGDLFRWNTASVAQTLPIQPSPLKIEAIIDVLGTEVVIERPVEFRFADDIRGEIRRNVDVVPRITVDVDQPLIIVPLAAMAQIRRVTATITNQSKQPVRGMGSLDVAGDLRTNEPMRPFDLKRKGEKTAVAFDFVVPANTKPGRYQVAAKAVVEGVSYGSTMRTIAYPHIQTHRFYRPATVDVVVIDLKTAPVKIGYIAGSGDRVREAIRQMGFAVEMISEAEMASGDLSRFNTIVVGIRAYQVRPDVVANNNRLLDFARAGGTLIVQYQLPAYASGGLTPYPTQMGPRVADENAAIRILASDHPLMNFPNKITDGDFTGWVQERNLYNFSNFAPEYTGLLESHDAGEAENSGGLVVAKLGKGNYIYCSYSMFRQLPAGVGGAYRLFANLLSYPKSAEK